MCALAIDCRQTIVVDITNCSGFYVSTSIVMKEFRGWFNILMSPLALFWFAQIGPRRQLLVANWVSSSWVLGVSLPKRGVDFDTYIDTILTVSLVTSFWHNFNNVFNVFLCDSHFNGNLTWLLIFLFLTMFSTIISIPFLILQFLIVFWQWGDINSNTFVLNGNFDIPLRQSFRQYSFWHFCWQCFINLFDNVYFDNGFGTFQNTRFDNFVLYNFVNIFPLLFLTLRFSNITFASPFTIIFDTLLNTGFLQSIQHYFWHSNK